MKTLGLSAPIRPRWGPQSVVSDVLAGKRALNLRQVKALAVRFSEPIEVFAPGA